MELEISRDRNGEYDHKGYGRENNLNVCKRYNNKLYIETFSKIVWYNKIIHIAQKYICNIRGGLL